MRFVSSPTSGPSCSGFSSPYPWAPGWTAQPRLAYQPLSLRVSVSGALARGIYVKIRGRSFLSPWLFVLAATFAFFSYAGQITRDLDKTDRAAVKRGVAQKGSEVTPTQRCVTKFLEGWDNASPQQRAQVSAILTPTFGIRSLATRFCAKAEREGNLDFSGGIFGSDAFTESVCEDGVMLSFWNVPVNQRAFTVADFRIFAKRYCKEAIARHLLATAKDNPARLQAFARRLLQQLVRSGEIHQIR